MFDHADRTGTDSSPSDQPAALPHLLCCAVRPPEPKCRHERGGSSFLQNVRILHGYLTAKFGSWWGQTGDIYWCTRQQKDSISKCDWSPVGSAAAKHRKLKVDSEAVIG
jgi:hypothetical protein